MSVYRPSNALPRRADVLALALLAAWVIIVFGVAAPINDHRKGDYGVHNEFARELGEHGRIETPHPLYQVLTAGVHRVIGDTNYWSSGMVVTAAALLAFGLLIYLLLRGVLEALSPGRAAAVALLLTMALLLAGPINLLTWNRANRYLGYLSAAAFHNPTILLLKPFALALFWLTFHGWERPASPARIAGLAVLIVLATLAKPNFTLVLLPLLGLWTLYRLWRRESVPWLAVLIGIGVPALAVLAWQYYFNATHGSGSGFEFAPFKVYRYFEPDRRWLVLKFVLSLLLPLAVLGCYFRRALRDRLLVLAWIGLVLGAFLTYFWAETPPRTYYGNFVWSGQITLVILYVMTIRFLLHENQAVLAGARGGWWRLALCLGLLGLHVAGGIAIYLHPTEV